MELKIDKELECLIPPLSASEFDQLETSVLEEGFRDKLIVWNGTLIDGHNRYRIAQKHGLEFEITEKEFDSKEDVKDWMYKNQLGRRNLTPEMRDYCIGQLYRSAKKKNGGRRRGEEFSVAQSGPLKSTAEKVGDQYGVSRNTVKRSEKFADGVDRIGEVAPGIKQDILQGKTSVTRTEIRELAKSTDEEVSAAVDVIRNPRPRSESQGVKTCTLCTFEKPLSDFRKGGSVCKTCLSSVESLGMSVTEFREKYDTTQMSKLAVVYDKMKNPPPSSGSGNNSLSDDPIITEMTETIKNFRNAMNKFLFIEEKTDKVLKDLIKETIEELNEINSIIKE